MKALIDHLVVTAPTLDAGAEYIRSALRVELDAGGEHVRMGTHNRLLRLGDALYLEVIAVNPQAPAPVRPRWFGLDAPVIAQKVHPGPVTMSRDPGRQQGRRDNAVAHAPRLATWVARVDDIDAAVAAYPGAGAIESMTRGALEWRITLPADGSLPYAGIMPSLIQWNAETHPASCLTERGCRLVALQGIHPQAERIWSTLRALHFHGPFTVSRGAPGDEPRLTALIETPHGPRSL